MFNPNDFSKLFESSMQDSTLKDKITPDEANKFQTAFQNPEFQKIFAEFAQEMSVETNRKDFEKQLSEAEKLAEAQQVVSEIQNPAPKMPVIIDKTPKTAAERVQLRKTQKGTKAVLDREKKEKLEQDELITKAKGLEQMYAQAMMKNRLDKGAKGENKDNEYDQTDFSKLNELVQQVEQMKQEFPDMKSNSKKEEVVFPHQLSYIQNSDYSDYIQDERVNIQNVRGADKVKLEVGIPEHINVKDIKLEVQENFIKITSGDIILKKDITEKLNTKEVNAKMVKSDKFKTPTVLQIEVALMKDKNAIFTDFSKSIKIDKTYESKPIEEVENDIEKLTQQMATSSVPVVQNNDEIKNAAKGWKKSEIATKPVEKVETSKTFEQILKENMNKEKEKDKLSLEQLEEGLASGKGTGVSFTFRGKVFQFHNQDIVDSFE